MPAPQVVYQKDALYLSCSLNFLMLSLAPFSSLLRTVLGFTAGSPQSWALLLAPLPRHGHQHFPSSSKENLSFPRYHEPPRSDLFCIWAFIVLFVSTFLYVWKLSKSIVGKHTFVFLLQELSNARLLAITQEVYILSRWRQTVANMSFFTYIKGQQF